MATAYLHINGTDYELPPNYATPNSDALSRLKSQLVPDPQPASAQPTHRLEVLLQGAKADLLINRANVTTIAVYLSPND